MKIQNIEVYFPIPVTLTSEQQQKLVDVVDSICKANVKEGRVMWPSGIGQKPIDIDRGLWDETTFQVEVFERAQSINELRRARETQ